MDILHSGKAGTSICPGQAAKKLANDDDERLRRPLMEPARKSRRLPSKLNLAF